MSAMRTLWSILDRPSGHAPDPAADAADQTSVEDAAQTNDQSQTNADDQTCEEPTDQAPTQTDDQSTDDQTCEEPTDASTAAPAPSAEEQNKEKNVAEGTKEFGTSGSKFNELKGSKDLNPRQKTIFDQKLKQAIENDPRAKSGAMSEADLKALAQQAADVTTKLAKTPLKKEVNELSVKSATLKDNIVDLQNNGWTIIVGAAGGGSFTDKAAKTITIDPSDNTKAIVEGLAHETGHAEYTPPADPPVTDPSPTIAKGREYIRKVVENNLLDEGQAQIVACQTAAELEAKGETGMNIPGTHSADYKAVYAKIVAGTLTMDQGRKEMAKIMGSETTSNSGENYIDYYSNAPRQNWNDAHSGAEVPAAPRVVVFP